MCRLAEFALLTSRHKAHGHFLAQGIVNSRQQSASFYTFFFAIGLVLSTVRANFPTLFHDGQAQGRTFDRCIINSPFFPVYPYMMRQGLSFAETKTVCIGSFVFGSQKFRQTPFWRLMSHGSLAQGHINKTMNGNAPLCRFFELRRQQDEFRSVGLEEVSQRSLTSPRNNRE